MEEQHSSASVYYTAALPPAFCIILAKCKLKNNKQERPGGEAVNNWLYPLYVKDHHILIVQLSGLIVLLETQYIIITIVRFLYWKLSQVCCSLYRYKCAAQVTMPTATNE